MHKPFDLIPTSQVMNAPGMSLVDCSGFRTSDTYLTVLWQTTSWNTYEPTMSLSVQNLVPLLVYAMP